jgi:two-component system CheB/CheR fusion protein
MPIVVGIGLSAGGIEPLGMLLRMITFRGAALVVVTHQPNDHLSHLPEVLQAFTMLEVTAVTSGIVVEANHLYVVPGSQHVALHSDRLVFEARGPRRARNIDHFFASLAKAKGREAIGVVLSGANSDGTEGLAAIRAAGGRTLVQSPRTARFAVMPHSAQNSADYSLAPAELGRQLMRLLT